MKRTVYTLLLVLLLAGIGVFFYVNYKPHRNVESEDAAVKISSIELFKRYSENEKLSDSLFLNKIIEVSGVVSEMNKDQKGERVLVLEAGDDIFAVVVCTINEADEANKNKIVKLGDKVTLKGICSGFADDVKLNKCVILNSGESKSL